MFPAYFELRGKNAGNAPNSNFYCCLKRAGSDQQLHSLFGPRARWSQTGSQQQEPRV